jgi:hypothetical protein
MVIMYPWEKLEPGDGFFVPGLNVEEIKERGLRAAVPQPFKVYGIPGVKDGMLGVWFYRRLPGCSWRSLYAKPATRPASLASDLEEDWTL